MVKPEKIDLFVIGGGINGAAITRDATGRGLSVMLAEKSDYASATSSASSKLIHGGLRYLEQYKFALVHESLREREVMMQIAPHLVTPLRFHIPIMTHHARPAWFIRIGLFLYDLLSGHKKLENSGQLNKREMADIPHLRKKDLKAVLHYPDCQVDDARLTLSTLLDARNRGADIANYREVMNITQDVDGYLIKYRENNKIKGVKTRFVVNTAGPWVNDLIDKIKPKQKKSGLRLVRGSHIVLNMPYPAHETAHTLQNEDGRVVFTIPWLNRKFLVIGTTDAPHAKLSEKPTCSKQEMDYLLDVYNRNFESQKGPVTSKDIVWTWSGIRSLADDGSADPSKVTRSARIIATRHKSGAIISVYGGKLTTHRRLAAKVMNKLNKFGAKLGPAWTADAPLYGGTLNVDQLSEKAMQSVGKVDQETWKRWIYTYGDQAQIILSNTTKKMIGPVYESELLYVHGCEDARTSEDFLFRRTKLGLFLTEKEKKDIESWFSKKTA